MRYLTLLFCLILADSAISQRNYTVNEKVAFEIRDASNLEIRDGSITPTITGGTRPFEYHWFGPDGFYSQDSVLHNITSGDYILNLRDVKCKRFTDTITVDARQKEYNGLVSLKMDEVRPNPFEEVFQVILHSTIEQSVDIQIFNENGTQCLNDTYFIKPGTETLEFDLIDFPSGIYILNLCNNVDCQRTEKLIKL